jgi:uroporphyrinogen-III decarboxylase
MNSRERILAALALKETDQVPFFDCVDPGIKSVLMGSEQFSETDFARKIGFDAIQIIDYLAPMFTEKPLEEHDYDFVGEGLIKTEKDLDLMVFPDPHNENFYDSAKKFMDQYGNEDFAIFAGIRAAMCNTIFSMGLTAFSYALYDNLKLVETIIDRFIDWNCAVAEKFQTLGVDCFAVYDDMAFNSGPFFSPQIFREVFLPRLKRLADTIKIPWAYHSDGNLMPVIDDLLSLGMNCLNPIDPMSMNIKEVKEKYGNRICLWGNIDLSYTLTRGTPGEVDAEVRQLIKDAGFNGGLIVASANSITEYCKLENVWAMAEAVKKYGKYPLNLD